MSQKQYYCTEIREMMSAAAHMTESHGRGKLSKNEMKIVTPATLSFP